GSAPMSRLQRNPPAVAAPGSRASIVHPNPYAQSHRGRSPPTSAAMPPATRMASTGRNSAPPSGHTFQNPISGFHEPGGTRTPARVLPQAADAERTPANPPYPAMSWNSPGRNPSGSAASPI